MDKEDRRYMIEFIKPDENNNKSMTCRKWRIDNNADFEKMMLLCKQAVEELKEIDALRAKLARFDHIKLDSIDPIEISNIIREIRK